MKKIDEATKNTILSEIKEGKITVIEASKKYGIHTSNIYNWIKLNQEKTSKVKKQPKAQPQKKSPEPIDKKDLIINMLTLENSNLKIQNKMLQESLGISY